MPGLYRFGIVCKSMDEVTTTDHQRIKTWATRHHATPQLIDDPKAKGDAVGIRLHLPATDDDRYLPFGDVKDVGWSEFFAHFERLKLAFIFEGDSYRFIKRSELNPGQAESHAALVKERRAVDEFWQRD